MEDGGGEGEDLTEEDAGSGSGPTHEKTAARGSKPALIPFRQTYDDNGNVIPLPLDGPAPGPSKERLAEIRRYDKEQFEKQQRREKRADQGIHTLVRGPGEVMAPVGRPVRARRAPLDANAAQELLDAKLMERFRAKKRKESENAAPAPKNKK